MQKGKPFKSLVSEATLPNRTRLFCNACQKFSEKISSLKHFVTLPVFLVVEFSSNSIKAMPFSLTMEILDSYFSLFFHCCWLSVDLYWWFMSFCANISITCSTTAELFNWLVFCDISKSDGWHFQCSTTYRILPWTTTKTCLRQCWTFKSW